MQIKRYSYGIKGFVRLVRYAIRWGRMVTKQAERKYKILIFLEKYGLPATLDAFSVGERTLDLWKAQLARAEGVVASLNNKSTRPHVTRKRVWPAAVTVEIARLRKEHPNLGKEKIYKLLQQFCEMKLLPCPAPKTIDYIITFVELYSRFTLAYATTSHTSKTAAEFFILVKDLFPCKLEYVLTDNGSEFMKEFDTALRQLHATHWHTYPRTQR